MAGRELLRRTGHDGRSRCARARVGAERDRARRLDRVAAAGAGRGRHATDRRAGGGDVRAGCRSPRRPRQRRHDHPLGRGRRCRRRGVHAWLGRSVQPEGRQGDGRLAVPHPGRRGDARLARRRSAGWVRRRTAATCTPTRCTTVGSRWSSATRHTGSTTRRRSTTGSPFPMPARSRASTWRWPRPCWHSKWPASGALSRMTRWSIGDFGAPGRCSGLRADSLTSRRLTARGFRAQCRVMR